MPSPVLNRVARRAPGSINEFGLSLKLESLRPFISHRMVLRIRNALNKFVVSEMQTVPWLLLGIGVRLPQFDETFPKGLLVLLCGMVLCD